MVGGCRIVLRKGRGCEHRDGNGWFLLEGRGVLDS